MASETEGKRRPFLVVGLGSVGSRHLKNLGTLGIRDIVLHRTGRGSPGVGPEEGRFPVESTLEAALARDPAGVIVSNPTAQHVDTAIQAARAGADLLIEKPLSNSLKGIQELAEEVEVRGLVVMVAFQFRFHPGLKTVREWLGDGRIGRPVSAQAFWGEYLPGWHPWEDYRSSYSALPELGGGVIHTLSHPLDYLQWLLGPVESVMAETGRLSDLEVEVEDAACITLKHRSGPLSIVYLDYARRPPRHDLEIVGTDGTIRWDNQDGHAHLFEAAGGSWTRKTPPPGFTRNDLFEAELRHFLECREGREDPACSLADGIRALRVALAAHRSAKEGVRVHV